jgi:hypothetical protein
LFVPVHGAARGASQGGTLALRTGRLSSGQRVGLAFTSEAALLLTLGPCQHWIRLDEDTLRDMLAPLGITSIRVDARPAAELRPLRRQPAIRPDLATRF